MGLSLSQALHACLLCVLRWGARPWGRMQCMRFPDTLAVARCMIACWPALGAGPLLVVLLRSVVGSACAFFALVPSGLAIVAPYARPPPLVLLLRCSLMHPLQCPSSEAPPLQSRHVLPKLLSSSARRRDATGVQAQYRGWLREPRAGLAPSVCMLQLACSLFLNSCLSGIQWAGSQSWLHPSSAEFGCYTV